MTPYNKIEALEGKARSAAAGIGEPTTALGTIGGLEVAVTCAPSEDGYHFSYKLGGYRISRLSLLKRLSQ